MAWTQPHTHSALKEITVYYHWCMAKMSCLTANRSDVSVLRTQHSRSFSDNLRIIIDGAICRRRSTNTSNIIDHFENGWNIKTAVLAIRKRTSQWGTASFDSLLSGRNYVCVYDALCTWTDWAAALPTSFRKPKEQHDVKPDNVIKNF
jgi:hypothetical protein